MLPADRDFFNAVDLVSQEFNQQPAGPARYTYTRLVTS